MKLLLFSDLHASPTAAAALVEQAAGADVAIGAGDFGNMRRGIADAVRLLAALPIPLVATPGNAESYEELCQAFQDGPAAQVLHGSQATLQGEVFYGLGGAVPVTPFGSWSYDFTEEQAAGLLAGCPSGCVLVTHAPPHGVVDRDSGGQHRGSTAIRQAILDLRPRLVVCGHIHASGGTVGDLDGVPVVNAGPQGVLWNLDAGRRLPL
ncbi:metallophosphoesterase family protein [Lignipirellula cremea]|uniref:Calcineurin-like phosphoesterase superfamily domain protein n=1 Tax=Lignipirellula cremea TaxID=2528010 RepID=A0A518DMU4_9BACT|nr:metallophosphoesterase [Lignipirellula cremea]QDU93160.1 Calcineurin-like phosphoesterase superfamily domain protein [Lignipirellula cremea]